MPFDVDTTLVRPYQLTNAASECGESTLADIATALTDARISAGRTYICPKCRAVGTHEKSLDTGKADDTVQVQCTLAVGAVACVGWGYLTAPVKMRFVNQWELA